MAKRDINKFRRADGTLTSDAAYRLFQSRAGRASARKAKELGYPNLLSEKARNKSRLTCALRARPVESQERWLAFRDLVLKLLASEHPTVYQAISRIDLDKLG